MLLATTLFVACSQDADTNNVDQLSQLRVTTTLVESTTRTMSLGLQSTQLDHSVDAGLYVYATGQTSIIADRYSSYDGYGYENLLYAYDDYNDTWKHNTIYLPKDRASAVDVFVYAPRVTTSPLATSMPFTVQADQSSEQGYLLSDFVFGNKKGISFNASGTTVNADVKLYHALSKIVLSIRDKEGQTSTLGRLYKAEIGTGLYPVYVDAYINLTPSIANNATLPPSGSVSTGGTTGVIQFLDRDPDTDATVEYYKMAVVLPPQNLPSTGSNLTITFKLDDTDQTEVAYEGNLPGTLLPGYAYYYNVTIDQKELTVSSARIVPWAEGTGKAWTVFETDVFHPANE